MTIAGRSYGACNQTKTTYSLVKLCVVCSLDPIFPWTESMIKIAFERPLIKKVWP